jgi:hypothetical protein
MFIVVSVVVRKLTRVLLNPTAVSAHINNTVLKQIIQNTISLPLIKFVIISSGYFTFYLAVDY